MLHGDSSPDNPTASRLHKGRQDTATARELRSTSHDSDGVVLLSFMQFSAFF